MQKSIRKYWPLFVLPTMAAFAIGFIIPFCYGVFLSFCKFTTVTDWKWVGVQNYTKIFYVAGKLDTTFLHSLWYTTLFTVVTMAIINIAAFAIAMALTKGIRGTNFFRTCFFLPNLIGGIVLSYIWLMIFNSVLAKHSGGKDRRRKQQTALNQHHPAIPSPDHHRLHVPDADQRLQALRSEPRADRRQPRQAVRTPCPEHLQHDVRQDRLAGRRPGKGSHLLYPCGSHFPYSE